MDIFDFTKALKLAVDDELSRKFSFGCVNYLSQCSHPDMTYKDFIISINTISKEFEEINWNSISNFNDLKIKGYEVEKEMFRQTSGKNTYKGLIFLSIILAYGFVKSDKIDDIPQFIKQISKPLISDYKTKETAIYYNDIGLRDVRFYPLTGFNMIFHLSQNSYTSPIDDLLLTIYLIANVDDTTTLNRSNIRELRFLQRWADTIYTTYNNGENILNQVKELNSYYVKTQISSGGVADIFTLTKTLFYLRRIYE